MRSVDIERNVSLIGNGVFVAVSAVNGLAATLTRSQFVFVVMNKCNICGGECASKPGMKVMWTGMTIFMIGVHLLPFHYFWVAQIGAPIMVVGLIMYLFNI